MATKEELRVFVRANVDEIVRLMNEALAGNGLPVLKPTLERVGAGGRLPHWFAELEKTSTLPNLDGKTIGSVVEMLLLAILETTILKPFLLGELRVNPARGVDLPDLDLGVKSPSTNYCTSEPFFSAYERLYGNEYDALVLLTDYQESKKKPPLRLRISKARYLSKSEIADANLCRLALQHRDALLRENEAWAQRYLRFLAFVNQSDWRARWLMNLLPYLFDDVGAATLIAAAREDFEKKNTALLAKDREPHPDRELEALTKIVAAKPIQLGIVDALDNWIAETLKDVARLPNENEWNRLLQSPLDGKIGMSFALQWRYNFGRVFGVETAEESVETCELAE